jgi:hypothetical protein
LKVYWMSSIAEWRWQREKLVKLKLEQDKSQSTREKIE